MRTLVLPGFSLNNKEWAQEIKERLNLGHEVKVIFWQHWEKGGSLAMNYELQKIIKLIGEDEVNIIAKSVGTRVSMNLVPKITKQINKLILCGIPTKGRSESVKKLYREGLSPLSPSQVIVVQNTKDPFANFKIIEKFIHSINLKIKVVEKQRSDHHYPYTEDFQKFLK